MKQKKHRHGGKRLKGVDSLAIRYKVVETPVTPRRVHFKQCAWVCCHRSEIDERRKKHTLCLSYATVPLQNFRGIAEKNSKLKWIGYWLLDHFSGQSFNQRVSIDFVKKIHESEQFSSNWTIKTFRTLHNTVWRFVASKDWSLILWIWSNLSWLFHDGMKWF